MNAKKHLFFQLNATFLQLQDIGNSTYIGYHLNEQLMSLFQKLLSM